MSWIVDPQHKMNSQYESAKDINYDNVINVFDEMKAREV